MKKLARALSLFLLPLAMSFALVSCGDDDDDNGTNPPPQADLSIQSIGFTPANPTVADSVTAQIVIKNNGTASAVPTRTRVQVGGVSTCAEIATGTLAVGATVTVTCELGQRAEGTHTVEACADITTLVTESNEQNNCQQGTLTVTSVGPQEQADLVISDISFTPAVPTVNDPITVTVTIMNQGDAAAPASQAKVEVDGVVTCGSITTGEIGVGSSATITCEVPAQLADDHVFRACADADSSVVEDDEDNNCDTVTLTITAGSDLPDLPMPGFPEGVDFGSQDSTAQQAEQMVNGLLFSAHAFTLLGQVFLNPVEGAVWNDLGNGCRDFTETQDGCTSLYEVCEVGTELVWDVTVNGTCYGQGPYVDWVAARWTTSMDGTGGTLLAYAENSTVVEASFSWTAAPDGKAGQWNFYEGDVDPLNLSAVIDWEEQTDGTQDVTWTVPDLTQIVLHIAADEQSGTMSTMSWDGVAWWQNGLISWDNPTGSWVTYDEEHNETIVGEW